MKVIEYTRSNKEDKNVEANFNCVSGTGYGSFLNCLYNLYTNTRANINARANVNTRANANTYPYADSI